MAMKIMWGAGLAFIGWIGYYLFARQLIFNLVTAFPLIRKMNETQEGLIAPGAKRYTVISSCVMGLLCLVICAVVFWFCPMYQKICFASGAVVCAFMLSGKISADNRDMFDSFCSTYYKFVPDDELRTAMYNKKPSRMKLRLHDMGLSTSFIPTFKKGQND